MPGPRSRHHGVIPVTMRQARRARAEWGCKPGNTAGRGFEPARQTRKAMVENRDIVYSATQHIDRLMRRVVLLMFGAGVLAVLAIWRMEADDGTIDPIDRFGYPVMVLVFSASFVALWRFPRVWATCAGSASCASRRAAGGPVGPDALARAADGQLQRADAVELAAAVLRDGVLHAARRATRSSRPRDPGVLRLLRSCAASPARPTRCRIDR